MDAEKNSTQSNCAETKDQGNCKNPALLVTVAEAARLTGYAKGTIRSLVSRGLVDSKQYGNCLWVSLTHVQEHMNKPRTRRKESELARLRKENAELRQEIAELRVGIGGCVATTLSKANFLEGRKWTHEKN